MDQLRRSGTGVTTSCSPWGPDAVVVCAETSRHREPVEKASAGGVHVLCEKPLATSLSDAGAMIQACADGGVQLMTASPVRFHPAARSALMLAEFLRCVRTGDRCRPDGEVGYRTLQIVRAADDSVRSGEAVRVGDPSGG